MESPQKLLLLSLSLLLPLFPCSQSWPMLSQLYNLSFYWSASPNHTWLSGPSSNILPGSPPDYLQLLPRNTHPGYSDITTTFGHHVYSLSLSPSSLSAAFPSDSSLIQEPTTEPSNLQGTSKYFLNELLNYKSACFVLIVVLILHQYNQERFFFKCC